MDPSHFIFAAVPDWDDPTYVAVCVSTRKEWEARGVPDDDLPEDDYERLFDILDKTPDVHLEMTMELTFRTEAPATVEQVIAGLEGPDLSNDSSFTTYINAS